MGTCYTILMMDEFDWNYLNKTKEETLAQFEEEMRKVRYIDGLEGTGYGWAIYDLDKTWPNYDPYYDVISKYCDVAYFWTDTGRLDIQKMERCTPLPPKKDYREEKKAKFTIEDLNKKLSETSI